MITRRKTQTPQIWELVINTVAVGTVEPIHFTESQCTWEGNITVPLKGGKSYKASLKGGRSAKALIDKFNKDLSTLEVQVFAPHEAEYHVPRILTSRVINEHDSYAISTVHNIPVDGRTKEEQKQHLKEVLAERLAEASVNPMSTLVYQLKTGMITRTDSKLIMPSDFDDEELDYDV